jgi:hypothetical protein
MIKPLFTVNGLEFSETLPDRYTWDDLMAITWPDGWRVPTRWELVMLYDEKPESHCDVSYWTATSVGSFGEYAWSVYFLYGYVIGGLRKHCYYVRLVRTLTR